MKGDMLQRSRLVAAIVFVVAIVFSVPLADTVLFSDNRVNDVDDVRTGLRAESVLQTGSIDEALDVIEQIAVQDEGEAPEWFQAEVGILPGARDVRTANGGQILSYVVDCDAKQALESLRELMEGIGWNAVPLGQADGFTFVKSSGTCTWALVTCTQIASATSVVVRLQ